MKVYIYSQNWVEGIWQYALAVRKGKRTLFFQASSTPHSMFYSCFKSDISVDFNLLHFMCIGQWQIYQFYNFFITHSTVFCYFGLDLSFNILLFLFVFFFWKIMLIWLLERLKNGKIFFIQGRQWHGSPEQYFYKFPYSFLLKPAHVLLIEKLQPSQ